MSENTANTANASARPVFLIGFMGSGKTTVGRTLAKLLDRTFLDTDERIVSEQGMPITQIFAEHGEAYFRDLETELLRQLEKELTGSNAPVISVGGGMPVREENRALMKRIGTVIYLKADPDTLVRRLEGDTSRPLLQGGDLKERILTLMEKRDSSYTQAAHIQLCTDSMSVREAARSASRLIQTKNS